MRNHTLLLAAPEEPQTGAAPFTAKRLSTPFRVSRRHWIAASVALTALAGGGALLASQWTRTPAAIVESRGTLIVTTNPPHALVVLDGERRGLAPLTLQVAAGEHILEVLTEGYPRRIPVMITAGDTVSQHIELPVPAATSGKLSLQTEPPGARASVDDKPVGVTPLTVEGLAPGPHTVMFTGDLGTVTHVVRIEAGQAASLVVPMGVPQGVPVSGWISVDAPVDVQVYENDRLLGTSRSDRIMVSTGRHQLTIVSEPLRYRSETTISVSPGRLTPVKLEWPMGSISFNAQPWAEVWLDGKRIGETPMGNVAVPIGPHKIVLRHPELGEHVVQTSVAVGVPSRVSVDLNQR